MAKKPPYIDPALKALLLEKAAHSSCTYKISAVAFDAKGDVLGHATNSHSRNWNVVSKYGRGRAGTAQHAERVLLGRYRDLVKTIIICRIGRTGKILPIDPCPVCVKVAAKYGAKIISVRPGDSTKEETNEEVD